MDTDHTPIRSPLVNTQLDQMNSLQRATESLRYFALSIEFWISPDGQAREWLRKNVHWSTVIMIPTVTAFPVVTMALWEVSSCVNSLTAIAGKLIVLPVLALLALISISIVCRIISAFIRR